MSGAAAILARAGPLRIFVSAADAARRDGLIDIVAREGHELVASVNDADVVLSETDRSGHGYLVVNVSGDDHDLAGLLESDADAQQIDAALRAVAAGLVVRMPNGAETGFRAIDESEGQGLLTPREIEVLNAIGEGLTNKAIARRLAISLHTVKFHAESIFRKLGVSTRTGAIKKASQRRQALTLEL
jgi:DNA-binding CsgD family transcriptional regulator